MYIPNDIKNLIHKYVLAIEHPVVKGLKDVRQKYWDTKMRECELPCIRTHLEWMKNISFYHGMDTAGGYQVNLPDSDVIGPYCEMCGSLTFVQTFWPQCRYIPQNKLCKCNYVQLPLH